MTHPCPTCPRRFWTRAGLHLHNAGHVVDQARWDRHCATTPGHLSPGVAAADFEMWEREVAR